jgi:hypothetical protein
MPRPRDILQRFRPAGTPGAASGAGVPVDRVAEASAELEPVIARLGEAQQEADRLRADAQVEAERRRQQAAEQGRALVAAARRQAEAERADATLRAARHGEAQAAAMRTAAEHEADEVRRRSAARLPIFVDRVVADVRASWRVGAETLP